MNATIFACLNVLVPVNVRSVAPEVLLFPVDLSLDHVHPIFAVDKYLRIADVRQFLGSHFVYDGWNSISFAESFLLLQLGIDHLLT